VFCRSLFVLLSFFFWPWCWLSFDLQLLITMNTNNINKTCTPTKQMGVEMKRTSWMFCITSTVVLYVSPRHPLSFCHFSFGHGVDCPLIYSFWLPLWYFQTFVKMIKSLEAKNFPWNKFYWRHNLNGTTKNKSTPFLNCCLQYAWCNNVIQYINIEDSISCSWSISLWKSLSAVHILSWISSNNN
jgi:hypothetical protein